MVHRTIRMWAVVIAVIGAVTIASPAFAGTAVERSGSCSGNSDWNLKLNPGNGAIEVEFQVDSNVAGQHWRVRIFQNGDKIFAARKTTRDPSGSFTARVTANDTAGTDRFRGVASQAATGESCVGRASI